jgi:hypothetical protein
MTKEEFLFKETRDLVDNFQTFRSAPPIFTLLFKDGSTESIALVFDKICYKLFMQKLCENPKVIACIFISECWLSKGADDTKPVSECDDKEEIIMLLYSTREKHECHLFEQTENGKLELLSVNNSFQGRFSNPFNSVGNLTHDEKKKSIRKFQESILETVSQAFEESKYVSPLMFFLTNTEEEYSFCSIPEDEWIDRISLIQKIKSKCSELETLAFMLEFPVEPDIVAFILVSNEIQEFFNYKISTESQTLEFVNRGIYNGEFSGVFKN